MVISIHPLPSFPHLCDLTQDSIAMDSPKARVLGYLSLPTLSLKETNDTRSNFMGERICFVYTG